MTRASGAAIRAENLSKLYHIGERDKLNRTLRDTWVDTFSRFNPFAGNGASSNGHAERLLWALRDVSFTIQPGEVVGIVGRNGAGKSTLLKVLSKITEPTSGKAELRGRLGSLLEVGTGFHPELTGRDNIYLNGSILGMTRREIERRFDEIVAFAELERFLDTPVKRYSSGMYVRLAFAVAAHLEPEILLVDEVLAVGDAAFQKKCLGKMTEVAKQGRTVLFVSHNTAAMLGLCQRGLLLENGRLTADGPIEAVIQQYLNSLKVIAPWDLSGYAERQGNGRVRFTSVGFEDEQGNPVEQGISGKPLVINLKYQAKETQPLPHCRASVTFYDLLGQPLFNCSSELVIKEPITLPSQGNLRLLIPRLPLSQSRYLLTLFFEVNREIEDWLQTAIALEVVDGDFYSTGRLYPAGWQGKGVLVPHQWIIGDNGSLS
jgi:lipopolysaccharide transport system ATP-binding protein